MVLHDSTAPLESLSPAKRAAFEAMLLAREEARAEADRIPRCSLDEAGCLSFAEQRLWFLDNLEPNHPFYNMPLAAQVKGGFDHDAFSRALGELGRRHETLRYAYDQIEGQPRRRIVQNVTISPEQIDLTDRPLDDQGLYATLQEESQKPFDLAKAPLFRCVVYKLAEEHHVVLLVMHHIVSDGWSMWVMLNEIGVAYEAFASGLPMPIVPLAVQYSDYAAWQRKRLTGDHFDELIAYWRGQLADAPPLLELPTDRPRGATQDFDGAVAEFTLADAVGEQLGLFATRRQATPFMVLLAAYLAWLARHTRQTDLLVGTVVAGRSRAELERLIGFFVNTLAIRGNLAANPSFEGLVAQIRATTLDALAHQDLPFDRLIESLTPDRDQSHAALFQTALVVQNPPRDFARGEGLEVEPMLVDNGTAKYDLTFFFWEDAGVWRGQIEYRTSLFDRSTIDRFATSFQILLEDALRAPEKSVSDLALIDAAQQRQIATWNATERAFPERLMHEVFERQAEERPDAIALRHAGRPTSYGELNLIADRMAAGLQSLGAGPREAVVCCLTRSRNAVATMLAILKTGGVYLPIEVDQAVQRLPTVLRDVGQAIVVTDLSPPNMGGMQFVTPEEVWEAGEDRRPVRPVIHRSDRAYILYTSGSTGQPKGVEIKHHNFVNLIYAKTDLMGIRSDDRLLHSLSLAFDGSLSEIWLALANGATLVVADRDQVLDPKQLGALMQSEGVTAVTIPPAILASLDPSMAPDLRVITTGGDTLTGELASRWIEGRRMFNGYGPTEATVGVAMHELTNPPPDKIPIGRPMDNMRVYILDERLQTVPIGVVGEVVIGGAGVGRGYLNRPKETALRFLPDPFAPPDRSTDPSTEARMYRTGDLGRWRADGSLDFCGRVDSQVQLRGYRVEPDEVAVALERSPQVAQSTVIVKPDSRGEPRLVAYVVPTTTDPSSPATNVNSAERQHVEAWRTLMDQSHQVAGALRDPEFDTTGWISTYTGQPIPKEQMREWANGAVRRILDLQPQDVLEIGCGTGLLLTQIAPHCRSYSGTDFLGRSLKQLQYVIDRSEELARRVELFEQAAHEMGALAGRRFDVVILNSVAQYFPSLDYLLRTLKNAVELLSPGGKIFLGDLRNLRLHEAMAASVEVARADNRLSRRELLGRIEARLRREEELLFDPELFGCLLDVLPRLSSCRVELKPGDSNNELTRFRYDVTMALDEPVGKDRWDFEIDGQAENLEDAQRRLDEKRPAAVAIRNVRNPRVANEVALLDKLAHSDESGPIERPSPVGDEVISPDAWRRWGEQLGYDVQVAWSESGRADCFDVLLRAPGAWGGRPSVRSDASPSDLERYANRPLHEKLSARLVPRLRSQLAETLPQYMVPSAFVVLNALPRTVQGKIDRSALPPPPSGRPAWATGYIAPRDDQERLVAEIWEQLLGVTPVGAEDNFFELGGHSMLAVRVMAEIESHTGQQPPLSALFQQPTVAFLASLIRDPDIAAVSSLVELQTTGAGAPLFCIHPAGGTVFCYRALAAHFAGERPVIGVQAVGVDGAQPPHESMEEMANHYAGLIRARTPKGPVHLCGWSIGGNIAHAVACQLCDEGVEVGLVGLFDAGATPPAEALAESELLPLLAALFPDLEHLEVEELRQKPPEEQVAYFAERAQQAGLVDASQFEASQYVFAVFQKNVQVVHEHRPKLYPGEVTLFRAGEQTKTNSLFDDPSLGWEPLADQFHVCSVPSDHAQMMNPPQVDALAESMKRRLSIRE